MALYPYNLLVTQNDRSTLAPVRNAKVVVYESGSNVLHPMYLDVGGTIQIDELRTNERGEAFFYTAPGRIRIEVWQDDLVIRKIEDVVIDTDSLTAINSLGLSKQDITVDLADANLNKVGSAIEVAELLEGWQVFAVQVRNLTEVQLAGGLPGAGMDIGFLPDNERDSWGRSVPLSQGSETTPAHFLVSTPINVQTADLKLYVRPDKDSEDNGAMIVSGTVRVRIWYINYSTFA